MTHPIIEPLVVQLPFNALSRKYIAEESSFDKIKQQLLNEQQWLRDPYSIDKSNKHNGVWYLEQNGYTQWLKDAENNDFIRMVGVIQLMLETFSALQEDLNEED